jgi:cytoskeletal protein CcmA (bactofilin family)
MGEPKVFHRQLQESTGSTEQQVQQNQTQTAEKENTTMSENQSSGMNEENTTASASTAPQGEAAPFDRAPLSSQSGQRYMAPTYGGAAAASSSQSSMANGSDRRLVVGPGITMSGEIDSCDVLVVEGTVEAALKGASVLEVMESGVFYGTVEISEAVISGRVEGDITVNGRLTVTSTGSVVGSISYKTLVVEAGASMDGSITPIGGGIPAKNTKTGKKKSSSIKSSTNTNDNAGEAEGLFSTGAAAE